MTVELTYDLFSDFGLASGDPGGRQPRPSRFHWIDGQDVIYLEEQPPGAARPCGYVFSLLTPAPPGRGVHGWKGLRFVDRTGRVLGEVGLEDGAHGPASFSVPPDEIDGGRLVFSKATPYGARADAYHLDLTGLAERKVDTGYGGLQPVTGLSFLWERDSA